MGVCSNKVDEVNQGAINLEPPFGGTRFFFAQFSQRL
jgi:hypothetical protein